MKKQNLLLLCASALAITAMPVSLDAQPQSIAMVQTSAVPVSEDECIVVNVNTPGTLGGEVIVKVDALSDITSLKVTGKINNADWETIRNMSNLQYLDASEATSTSLPERQFQYKSTLTTVLLPKSLKSIGENAFNECGIYEIEIPAGVTTLPYYSFCECPNLKTVTFAEGSELKTIGTEAFYISRALESIVLPEGLESIGYEAFSFCTALKEVTLPKSLREIDSSAFAYDSALEHIDLPEGLKKIGNFSFGCTSIDSAIIPIGCTEIEGGAFAYCTRLTHVSLPACATYGYNVFTEDVAIKEVTCLSATPPALKDDFLYVKIEEATLKVPEFAIAAYKLDSFWMKFGTITACEPVNYFAFNSAYLLNSDNAFTNRPAVDLYYDTKLTISGSTDVELSDLSIELGAGKQALLISSADIYADNATLRFDVYADLWYFITPPFNISLNDIKHSNDKASFVFRYYDGASRAANGPGKSWKNVNYEHVNEAGEAYPCDTLYAGIGYIVQTNKNGQIIFSADNVKFDYSNPVYSTALQSHDAVAPEDANWNFLGNPYLAFFDIKGLNVTTPITVYDSSRWTYIPYSVIDDEFALRPMQAFFVQKIDGIESVDMLSDACAFTANKTTTQYAPANKQYSADRSLCNITLRNGDYYDRTRVVINADADIKYEMECDAPKFFSDNQRVPQIYTLGSDNAYMAINERPVADGYVQLGFYAPTADTYTIEMEGDNGRFTLTDLYTGAVVDDSYTFSVEEAGWNESRFVLALNGTGTSGIDSALSSEATVKVSGSAIHVTQCRGANVKVYTLDGKLIYRTKANGSATINVAPGAYIVDVTGHKAVKCLVK